MKKKYDIKTTDVETLKKWYHLMTLGRALDEKAPSYQLQSLGWSYHAPYAGHDGIQLAVGQVFTLGEDFLFPYYRDMPVSYTHLIAFLAGEYPNRIARSRLLQEFNFPETLPIGMPSTLLERRPDIRQAEQKLIAANAKVGVAYTNMFPRLALTGGFGSESTSLSELLKSPYAVMEGALLTPIFGWGKNRAALKGKKAAYEAEIHSLSLIHI